ncbi:MAG: hypothetical protein WCI55_08690 [Armatimonadota bacterium]
MLFTAPSTFQDTSFEVLSIERMIKPAFRLGSEVVDTIVVRRDVLRYTITLSPQHTICGKVKKFAVGDKITIKNDEIHDGDRINRDSIRLVK